MDITKVKRFFDTYNTFLILGHTEPDGDCIASQLSLKTFLIRSGKKAYCFSSGPFERPEIVKFKRQFESTITPDMFTDSTAVIIVDCSTPERVGELYEAIAQKTILTIDHHKERENFGTYSIIDPKAPSTTWLIYMLISSLGYTPTSEEALLLLFGLCTDTGFFRHLDTNSYDVFPLVSDLISKGASLKQVYSMMYGGRTLAQRKYLARLIKRAESYMDDRIILTYATMKDKKLSGPLSRSSDELYGLLQTINNNEIVIFIRQESDTHCSVGLRSIKKYDVAKVAKTFGGGGHKLAAGFSAKGTIKQIKKIILKNLTQTLVKKA
ncbi:MAG: bifunctional oligoribonuclease/PAP phosphatase NrnA [Spirochaetales bacterium]|nr:bifunctional oligoribonuclease/PAP phosphatase NrnA [Spirochaetales bacterium]